MYERDEEYVMNCFGHMERMHEKGMVIFVYNKHAGWYYTYINIQYGVCKKNQ